MANKTSPHILNTSANLLGFCLFVITSLQISDKMEADYIDEFTCIIAIILTFSCIFPLFQFGLVSLKEKNY